MIYVEDSYDFFDYLINNFTNNFKETNSHMLLNLYPGTQL